MILVHGARVLRPVTFEAEALDVLIEGDSIADLVPHGQVRGEGMERIDAAKGVLQPRYEGSYRRPYRDDPAPRRDLVPRRDFLTTTRPPSIPKTGTTPKLGSTFRGDDS